ncbi:hypothetical protein DY000_02010378 [Brassica cretica]|uniref:Fe2OG dioxygenase domain-containing protein n=1 Tax=Brassica cretica TaxID=69181 RepID=A0ABQ7CGS2_BRACR|nr:hypothetical protein DY000_02010378 [Brassica cretica]
MREMENKTRQEASTIKVPCKLTPFFHLDLVILQESSIRMREMENKGLPLICLDLANFDLHQSAVSLKQACMDCGFFYVINHGISEELKEEVFEQSKKFFDLPLEDKMKALRDETHRGYSPALEQNQIHGDYNKESFFMGTEDVLPGWQTTMENYHLELLRVCTAIARILALALDLDADYFDTSEMLENPIAYMRLLHYEDVLPGWRMTMENYHQELLRVCKATARILALALDLDADYFNTSEMLENPIAYMRLLHYEGGMSDSSRGIYGCGAHTDHGMMTLLDGVMGLQICKDKDMKPQKWEYVPSIDGAYIVNLGDVLERWSNGLFKSTMLEYCAWSGLSVSIKFMLTLFTCPLFVFIVEELLATVSFLSVSTMKIVLNGFNLISSQIPFFWSPSHDCLIECLPTCQSENNLPKYPAITCSAYLTQRYKESHRETRASPENRPK